VVNTEMQPVFAARFQKESPKEFTP
jgi:hypothetical protein